MKQPIENLEMPKTDSTGRLTICGYTEPREHLLRLALWRLVGWMMRLMPYNKIRTLWLRIFGAKMGPCCHVYPSVRIYAPWNLTLGRWTCIGPRVEIFDKGPVKIGDEVVISQDAYLCAASHDVSDRHMALVTKPIVIGDHAWVAARATVLPGVILGEGAVVGACSVVAKDIPAWKIAVGNPVRIVKDRKIRA